MSDASARQAATDPSRNVVLEASAGTGKTRVLVDRYVNLLLTGVDPEHILAVTFTRKAAMEMRNRIVQRLRDASGRSLFDLARWRELRDRLGDITISTIDAFCLSLLHEFPLEADIDPGFALADETEVLRLVAESLDQALRVCRILAQEDDDVSLLFAQLGERRLRAGLGALLDRRLVAPLALKHYLARGPNDLTASTACRLAAERIRDVLIGVPTGIQEFLADGPHRHLQFAMLAADIERLCDHPESLALDTRDGQAAFRALLDRLRGYFLTRDGRPRGTTFSGTIFNAAHCRTPDAWRRHRHAAGRLASSVADAIHGFRRDLNVILARGVWRVFAVALSQYRRTLDARRLLDFSGVLERAIQLLKDMDEFARSRYRIEARYRHVLVDEFQDTSRAQWELVAQLVKAWGEGAGASADALPPSIFIVGDRKQSIYGFRDADVSVLDDAAAFVERLRSQGSPRHAISESFRAVPSLLAFVNDVFEGLEHGPESWHRFEYRDIDRFPVPDLLDGEPRLGMVPGESVAACAEGVAREVERLLAEEVISDRTTAGSRVTQPADIAILFRARESHREFEAALERHGISTYVYKGLGFFEAEEVQDGVALLRYLADPVSELRAAAFLRSRVVRLSDPAINRLAPGLAAALLADALPAGFDVLGHEDQQVLISVREALPRWLSWVDRMPPVQLLDMVLSEAAYAYETRGARRVQARENLKKLRGMVARFQNRGYATLARVAAHLGALAVGDESNATIDAQDAVSLMTIHAAKGLEFPVVFLVNIGRGTGGVRAPIRIAWDRGGETGVSIADYQSEADRDSQDRDREETKRLLYVALTRARERLYLSTTTEHGACRTGRGSLGEVLPASLKLSLGAASGLREGADIPWHGPSGHVHRFKVRGREVTRSQEG